MPNPRVPFVKRILQLRVLLVVNVVILVFLSLSFGREFVRNFEIQKDIERLQSQAEDLEVKNFQIAELNTAFQTESFIEREARLKLGMKKPGEQVVVIQGDDVRGEEREGEALGESEDPLNILTQEENAMKRVANPTKWWYYFFDTNQFNNLTDYER